MGIGGGSRAVVIDEDQLRHLYAFASGLVSFIMSLRIQSPTGSSRASQPNCENSGDVSKSLLPTANASDASLALMQETYRELLGAPLRLQFGYVLVRFWV